MAKDSWDDLTSSQKAAVGLAVAVQLGLLASALVDLRRRPRREVRGSKWAWVALSFVNYVGPVAYFFFGRRR